MPALAKVQARGQVTLPSEIRRRAGLKPGDTVVVRLTKQGVVELSPLPSLTVDELFALYPIQGPIDEPADREAWQAKAAAEIFGQ